MSRIRHNRMNNITLIIGASKNPERYSYKAANRLLDKEHSIIALGRTSAHTPNFDITDQWPEPESIHTITLYLNPARQTAEIQQNILELRPKRIIFNPGTENRSFQDKASQKGIEVLEACTLVLLSTNQY